MSARANKGVENSRRNPRLAQAATASLIELPGPNFEAVYARLPNGEADAGSINHPILEHVSPS